MLNSLADCAADNYVLTFFKFDLWIQVSSGDHYIFSHISLSYYMWPSSNIKKNKFTFVQIWEVFLRKLTYKNNQIADIWLD
jgi:hypothetical protein